MKTVYYYVNDRFVYDNGEFGGINVMLFGGDYDENYWFAEYHTLSFQDAYDWISEYQVAHQVNMMKYEPTEPIQNRLYTAQELMEFEKNGGKKRYYRR